MPGLTGPSRGLTGGGALRGAGLLASTQLRRILLPLLGGLLVLGLIPLVAPLQRLLDEPGSLDEAVLVGELPDAPVRLAVVMDISGSMSSYWSAREAALWDLVEWSTRTLRPTDSISVFVFGTDGQCLLPETTIGELAGGSWRLQSIGDVGGGTVVESVLPVLEAELGPEPHVVAWITDTEIASVSRSHVLATTSTVSVISMTTLLPGAASADANWKQAFPNSHYRSVDPNSADDMGVALAHAIANATGQKVRVG